MPRLWIAAIIAVLAALGIAPAAAQAHVTSSTITSWVSSDGHTPANDPYLLYTPNPPAPTLTVKGQANVESPIDTVDVDCSYGSGPTVVPLATGVPVSGGTFTATVSSTNFQKLVGHACQLRALDHADATKTAAAGPQLAVSETDYVSVASGQPNNGSKPYNFYLNATTLTGTVAWSAPGTPSRNGINPLSCGGPNLSPIDSSFNVGNPAIDCAGALMSDDLGVWGGRSEVQIDGRNAYDAAAAQALFAAKSGPTPTPASQTLAGFPSLSTSVRWDPASGLMSSTSTESWAACDGPNSELPTYATCPDFTPTGVQLQRTTTTGDGGRVATVTDTWSSTDGKSHSLDLLYDDYAGLLGNADSERGWEFPGQSSFAQYTKGSSVPAPATVPASILMRTNVSAADGNPNEGFGAITFGSAPSGLRFASGSELEERRTVMVPTGGSASLSYVYSVGYSLADVTGLAMNGQDRFQPAAVQIASPADGATVSTASATVTGTAFAGSGITSLVVGGQTVPVAPDGTWSAQMPLNPGANTITAVATDRAGAATQTQVTVFYQSPPSSSSLPPTPTPTPVVAKCHVPRTKGMKLRGAEKALRKAHCRVGKVKHVSSRKLARGRVMSTTPHAGRWLPAGAKIEVFVSKGP
ncbi:MAG: PASTA domain-containing protein [Solirubrobacteraceae bacterium]